jgi:peptide/nickel transport system substrate-binding protein
MLINAGRMDRRAALRVLLGVGATTLLAACGAPAPSAAPTSPPVAAPKPTTQGAVGASATSAPAPAQPKVGGTLKVGLQLDLTGLDPHNANRDTLLNVFDHIIYEHGSQEPKPLLAESWEQSADGKAVTWRLRKGVMFHTGRELTADDLAWNTNRVRDPKGGGPGYAGSMSPVKAVEVPDKSTVIWRTEQPWPWFDYASLGWPIGDPVTMQGPEATTKAVGTGPFTFVEWLPGSTIRLAKNKNYWQSGVPYLDEIQFSIIPDASALANALEAGSVDLILNPSRVDLARLRNDPKYQVLVNELGGNMLILTWNVAQEPGSNKQVRQALNYAIDRKRILEQVLLGIGQSNSLPWGAAASAYDAAKNQHYTFDLDRAKSLLAAAGKSNITVDFNYNPTSAEWAAIAQIYQSDLAKIGVTLNLKPAEAPALAAMFMGRNFGGLYAGQTQYGRVPPPQPYYDPTTNVSNFKSEQYQQLHTALSTALTPDTQKQAAAALNDFMLDETWAMPIADFLPMAVATQRVQGLTYWMNQRIIYAGAWLA